ncbi:MAG: DUF4340 domain-containing protein [Pseudomonadota bacterium]
MKKPVHSRRGSVNAMLYVGVFAMAMITYYDYRARNAPAEPVPVFASAEIVAISIHRPGYLTSVVARDAGDWRITAPLTRRADPKRIDALLSLGQYQSTEGYALEEIDPKQMGLTSPQATLELITDSDRFDVSLGALGPNNERRYLQINNRVWLTADNYLPLLQGGLRAVADLSLIAGSATVRSVSVDGLRSDAAEIRANWRALQAAGIEPFDDFATPNVWVELDDGSKQSFTLLKREDDLALIPSQADYALRLTHEQARGLGLHD